MIRPMVLAALWPLLLLARSNPFVPQEEPDHISHSRAIPPPQLYEQNLSLPPSARLLKSITLTHQNIDGSIDQVQTPIERLIDHDAPVVIAQPSARIFPRQMGLFRPVEALEGFAPLQIYNAEDILKIQTRHTLKNSFFLPEPSRIVLDFSYPDSVEPIESTLESDYFTHLAIEPHSDFFRLILTLKTHYPFTIESIREGYLLGLN